MLNKYKKNLEEILAVGTKSKRDEHLEHLLFNDSKFTHNNKNNSNDENKPQRKDLNVLDVVMDINYDQEMI